MRKIGYAMLVIASISALVSISLIICGSVFRNEVMVKIGKIISLIDGGITYGIFAMVLAGIGREE